MYIKYYSTIFLLLWSALLFGQVDSDSIATQVELKEVIVSSSKETFRYKELPASVSLITASRLERENTISLRGVTSLAPNFYMPEYGSKLTSPVYIRGIGSRINSPSVGLYVDGIPYFEKSTFDFDFFDVAYVEILRGPQGTLYGRNTLGGLINVSTQSPLNYNGTHLLLSLGNYQYKRATLSNYSKIGNRLGISAGVSYYGRGGYYTNQYTGGKDDAFDDVSGRIRLAFQHNDRATSELTATYEYSKQYGYAYALYDTQTGESQPVNYDEPSSYTRNLLSTGYQFTQNTDWGNIRAITGYQYFSDKQSIDQDWTTDDLFRADFKNKQHMLSQEIIAKSNFDKNYRWVTGVFAFYQQIDNPVNIDYNLPVPSGLPPHIIAQMLAGMPDSSSVSNDIRTYGLAAYHQSTFNNLLIEGLSATIGLRLDYESSSQDYKEEFWTKDGSLRTTTPETTLNFTELVPKVALRYGFGKHAVYASVSKGYKAGGFNSLVEEEAYRSFEPEQSWNYEVGLKMQWGNKITAELSGFYIDITNQQVSRSVLSGMGQMVVNAGRSASVGAEVSIASQPFRNFNVNLNYGYTHATFKEYIYTSYNQQTKKTDSLDLGGNYVPQVPRQTLSLGATYRYPVNVSWLDAITFHALYTGIGEIYWNEKNSDKQSNYGLLNASIGFSKSIVDISVWANNVLDTQYNVFYFEIPQMNTSYIQKGKPFTMGVDVRIKF